MTADLTERLTHDEARRLTDDLRDRLGSVQRSLDEARDLAIEAYSRRAWEALGYVSWAAYVSEEIGSDRVRVDRDDRRAIAIEMRAAGMPRPAIGAALGVSEGTIRNDERSQDYERPERVTDSLGRSQPATKPPRAEATGAPAPVDTPEPTDDVATLADEPASDPVGDWLDGGQALQDEKYMHSFLKALGKGHDFLAFDAERVAQLANEAEVQTLVYLADSTEKYLDRVRKARRGLRIVGGGK